MNPEVSRRLVLLVAAAALVLNIVGLSLFLINSVIWGNSLEGYLSNLVGRLSSFVLPLTGAVIVYKRPGNLVGWSIIGGGLLFALATLALEYSGLALDRRLAYGVWGAWVFSCIEVIGYGWLATFPLYFPNGQLLSPRWRPVLWVAVLSTVSLAASLAFRDGLIEEGYWSGVLNPAGVPAFDPFIDEVRLGSQVLIGLSLLLGMSSLALRLFRSRGDEQEQVKWVALAVAIVIVTYTLSQSSNDAWAPWTFLVFAIAMMLLPVSMAIAILRYHLYDIDRWISHTIVYLVVTIALVTTYAVLVVTLQTLTSPLAGGDDITVVVTTLAVAALFLPVRQRIQAAVDRRFYRRRFDAERTVQSFAARLREQIDLQSLQSDLIGVVDETLKPSATSLWLAKRD